MNHRTRVGIAVVATVVLFLTVQFGALALIEPFHDADRQAVENPDDPTISVLYVAVLLVATAGMLAAFKYDAQWVIRVLLIGVSGVLAWFVFTELAPSTITVGSVDLLPVAGALLVVLALAVYPEWYVIDATGVLIGAGAAALFGISFGLLPAIIFLVALAVYDAISVYTTGHMLDLAEGAMNLKIPVLFIIPTTLSYSYLTDESGFEGQTADGEAADDAVAAAEDGDAAADPVEAVGGSIESEVTGDLDRPVTGSAAADDRRSGDASDRGPDDDDESPTGDTESASENGGRDALFIGLGDAVIPTILVASAAHFLDAGALSTPFVSLTVPALGAIVGTSVGLLVLLGMVLRGRPHAGLPLLNGGAIAGYLLGALISGVSIATALGL